MAPRQQMCQFADLLAEQSDFVIGEEIRCAGCSATVWKAMPKAGDAMGSEVAVKLLKKGRETSDTPREVSLLKKAGGHPNVLRVHGVFWVACRLSDCEEDLGDARADELRQVMVTDYCEGGSLCQQISDGGAYSSQDAARLCHDLLQALSHVHALALVHRDIQPANVLLRGNGQAVLTGFSLAVGIWDEEICKRSGAPGYIAPEVILHGVSSPASDVFSLGCTLCGALSGVGSPFEGADVVSSVRNTLMAQPRLTGSTHIETLSAQGVTLLHGILEKSPERRSTVAEALMDPWVLLC